MFYKIFYTLLVLATFSLHRSVGEHDEDTWIEPNAWGREVPGWKDNLRLEDNLLNTCPVCELDSATLEDGVAFIYYKKLIANLFGRKKLQFNEYSAQYGRSLSFTLLPAQLEKLEQLSDPRDIDGVLMEIFATARTINTFGNNVDSSMGITALILDIVKDSFELLKISEVQFSLIVASAVILCWFLHNRYEIGYIRLGFVSLFLFGFFFTYLDCNRKLEIDEVIEYISSAPNIDSKPSWYSPMRWFWKSEENVEVKQLKKNRNLKMRFCRPDHVLIMYLNDLFMKQFESLLEKLVSTSSSLSNNLSFPYNLMAPVLLFSLIGYILKLTYKYILSPRAWASLLHFKNQQQQHPHLHQQQISHNGANAITEDRISGENLKLLLNAIKPPNLLVANASSSSIPAVSGVQEVNLEQIEAKPIPTNDHNVESVVKDNNNVNSKETLNIVNLSDSLDDSEEMKD